MKAIAMSNDISMMFQGGPHDGQCWKTCAHLCSLNPIDRWDDNTIERGMASPMVPSEIMAINTLYPDGAEEIPERPKGKHVYRFSHECEPGCSLYVFVESK